MKRKGILTKIIAVCAGSLGMLVNPAAVFAANPYGIVYSGGAELSSSNLTINANAVDGLKRVPTGQITVSDSNEWNEGYVKSGATGECLGPYPYFKVHKNDTINASSGLSWVAEDDKYHSDVKITGVTFEDLDNNFTNDEFIAVYVAKGGTVNAGFEMYSNSQCTDESKINNVRKLQPTEARLFIEFNLKLYKNNQNGVFSIDPLYLGITDIDSAQSFKILNSDNLFTKNNMYTASASDLQPESGDLKNMFVSSGNYIYSQYGPGDTIFNLTEGGNIYAKITSSVQQNGLDVVFGFAKGAGSNVSYYAKLYEVKYLSDNHGSITGIEDEDVIGGDSPAGSSSAANQHYRFDHWIADKNVTLQNGTTINAGQPLTAAQVKQVVVNSNLEFTAIHVPIMYEVEYDSDSHGVISGIDSEDVMSGEHPSGSTSTPNQYYRFDHWIADKSVTLQNGTTIEAGQSLTSAQVQQVVVNRNLKFTAIHEAIMYEVEYDSDDHGTISGIDSEDVMGGQNPTGSTSTPEEHYSFDYWIADKNVTLQNGTTINAGQPLTPAQVQQVVVTSNLKFTAIHEAIMYEVTYSSDDNGEITGIDSEDVMSGQNPTGSESTPNEHYEFDHWIADKNVTLGDGTTINAGEPLTEEQVQQVVVTSDLEFTAIHEMIVYEVEYTSDDNGSITGTTNEEVNSGDSPTGSTSTPNENYEFDYWIADEDVTLVDGTTIAAGEPLTEEQVKQVVVTSNLTFTAIHKERVSEATTPDTGFSTDEGKTAQIAAPLAGAILCGLTVTIVSGFVCRKYFINK